MLTALRMLAGDRPISIGGMGGVLYGRIPFASIEAFASRYGLLDDLDEFEEFVTLVGTFDADEVARLNEMANKK